MRIKRYMAESMRAALAQVRAEQGPDAVILSSRRVAEGIEVIMEFTVHCVTIISLYGSAF